MTDTTGVARVSHRFSVPAERVYDAFLDVSKARRFLYASPAGEIVQAELDPRVGGAYVITDQRDVPRSSTRARISSSSGHGGSCSSD